MPRMDVPETRYATPADGVHIAYQVVGKGPFDVVYVPGWISNLEVVRDLPLHGPFLRRLASTARLILSDRRGSGVSDRPPQHEVPGGRVRRRRHPGGHGCRRLRPRRLLRFRGRRDLVSRLRRLASRARAGTHSVRHLGAVPQGAGLSVGLGPRRDSRVRATPGAGVGNRGVLALQPRDGRALEGG